MDATVKVKPIWGKMDATVKVKPIWEKMDAEIVKTLLQAGSAGVALVDELPPPPVMVEGDRDRLMQVLINLLSNANKFSEPEHGAVVIRMHTLGPVIRIEVKDNGPGIPPEDVARIFEKFHQVNDPQKGKRTGTGLGLAITQRIVEHHRGRIWADSRVGDGTTISIELPVLAGARARSRAAAGG